MRSASILALLVSSVGLAAAPRVNLEVYRADLHNVLRLFAEVGHVNLVVDEDVKGTVTLKLRNVDWRSALETVAASHSLGVEQRGDILRVGSLKQLAAEAEERANLAAKRHQAAPLATRIIPVNYARAADLVPQVKAMLSDRGSVTYDERTNVLIVRDVDESR